MIAMTMIYIKNSKSFGYFCFLCISWDARRKLIFLTKVCRANAMPYQGCDATSCRYCFSIFVIK
jgi:hypothetical protein